MRNYRRYIAVAFVCLILIGSITIDQAQTQATNVGNSNRNQANRRESRHAGFSLMPPEAQLPGSGVSFSIMASGPNLPVLGSGTVGRLPKWTGLTSSNSYVGDSTIFEDKNGLVGVGTDSPTSKLTVMGLIESKGAGGFKFPDGTIQTTAGITSLFHDATLTGTGAQASPLGVAIPLVLSGVGGPPFSFIPVLRVVNLDEEGIAIKTTGGASNNVPGGIGVAAGGGASVTNFGGEGVLAFGGSSTVGPGGSGISANGGGSDSNFGGPGVLSIGGEGKTNGGGSGVVALGGKGSGAGNTGGTGLFAMGGEGNNGATNGRAASFMGDVQVQGNFNVTGGGTKNFKIDHPLDPANKYLYHAAVESSEVLNIYSGNVTTDANGEAVVALPEWFEAINRDFRYQLTVLGAFAQAIVAGKIKENHFTIKTNAPEIEVSWQVTAVRSDAAMLKNPFKTEVAKPESERGYYLSPEAYDQPIERSVEHARNPQMVQQLKRQSLKVNQLEKQE